MQHLQRTAISALKKKEKKKVENTRLSVSQYNICFYNYYRFHNYYFHNCIYLTKIVKLVPLLSKNPCKQVEKLCKFRFS